MHVYLIQNMVNGKCYVGQHAGEDLQKYWNHRIADAILNKDSVRLLFRAIRKYGPESFTIRTIYTPADKQDMDKAEIAYIAFFGTQNREFGYNMTAGGEGTWGFRHTEEYKRRMSESKKGKSNGPPTAEHREKVRQSKLGKKREPFSAECIQRMSAVRTGKSHTAETKAKMSAAALGKPKSENAKQAMKDAWIRRKKQHSEVLNGADTTGRE